MLGLLLTLLASVGTVEVDVPANDGWVTDLAGLLSDSQEAELEALMESYEQGSSHEVALLTLPSLKGETIERTALEVARAWGLGKLDANNGALLVVAREERKVRIEVGRGLEGNLTDSISGRIIRDVIVPDFRRDRYPQGIRAGIVAIHAAAGGDYGPLERTRGSKAGSIAGALLIGIVVLLVVFVRAANASMRGGPTRGRSQGWFWGMSSGSSGSVFGGGGGGGFGGFGGGGGFSGGGASGGW